MMIDLLPTIVELTGGTPPTRAIDGRSIVPLLSGDPEAGDPHEALFFWYRNDELQAMRMGRWKLHFPHVYRSLSGRAGGNNGRPTKYDYGIRIGLELFDLERDPGETTDVAADHPEVVAKMTALADQARGRLGDTLTGAEGTEVRRPRIIPLEKTPTN